MIFLQDLNIRIPAGTSSHSVLTLSERGFKKLEQLTAHGDHYVHLKVRIPERLSQEQRELIEEFALLETETPGTIAGLEAARSRLADRSVQEKE